MGAQLFLGRYQVVRLLADGGMGRTYLARQAEPDRQVVVKVLLPDLASVQQYRDAFRQEIEFLSRFRHPYAVELYEASMDDPQGPCAVMEFVDGLALDSLLQREGRLAPSRVGRLLGQLCAVLQAAHDQGVVHRDLKPANIMVMEAGMPGERLKVLDFGLARQATTAEQGVYIPLEKFSGSRAHKAVGTPEYTCPEQFRGEEVDHRGDLYSVGILLYELLAGRLPFQSDNIAGLVEEHLRQDPPALVATAGPGQVSRDIEKVVHACLAKDPAGRPQSARELALRFGQALGETIWNEQEASASPVSSAAPPARDEAEASGALVYRFEAWMPETIAALKLRGFVDGRGEVSDSSPGSLRFRLRKPRKVAPSPAPGFLARLGLGKNPEPSPVFDVVVMDVLMERPDAARPNKLLVSVRMHRPKVVEVEAEDWIAWCEGVQAEMASYLMAKRL